MSRVARFRKDTEAGTRYSKLLQFHIWIVSRFWKSGPSLEFSCHKYFSSSRFWNDFPHQLAPQVGPPLSQNHSFLLECNIRSITDGMTNKISLYSHIFRTLSLQKDSTGNCPCHSSVIKIAIRYQFLQVRPCNLGNGSNKISFCFCWEEKGRDLEYSPAR